MNKKKIWIFNHYIVSPTLNPVNRHSTFAKHLSKNGHDLTLFFSSFRHNSDSYLTDNKSAYKIEESDRGKYIAIRTRKYKGNGIGRVLNILDYYRGLMKYYNHFVAEFGKPDIIYASSVHLLTLVAGIKIAKKLNIKCVCEVRDLWPLTLVEMGLIKNKSIVTKLLYKLEKWIYKNADKLIFTMEGGRDYIKDKGWDSEINLNKVNYINNGIDLDAFDENLKNYQIEDIDLEDINDFRVMYTGSIGKANALDRLINVAEIIEEQGIKNIKFYIYGEGPEKDKLQKYVVEKNINNVKFKGEVSKTLIPSILIHSSLNFFTLEHLPNLFKYGLSPNKLYDYLASEKPVMSIVNCGYNILIKYEAGIVIENDDAEAMVETVLKFYNMPQEEYDKYCENAKKTAKEFDFKVLTHKLEEVLFDW